MTAEDLHRKLIEAYTIENLNNISLTLINLFRNGQFSVLQKIAEIISDFVNIEISDEGKGFSRLMMLYHPDRAGYHINEINRLTAEGNFDALLGYSHILKLERIDEIASSIHSYEDIDYAPVYEWDLDIAGFRIVTADQQKGYSGKTNTKLVGYSFFEALKLREYGDMEIELPVYYLEDIEDFELSSSDITDLDGIQYCIHAKTIDLSDNRITDIIQLIGLKNLEELNLSDNRIEYIDVLGTLKNLKSVGLSNNLIEDISSLFELEKLDYVDLSGNNVDEMQIRRLVESGVTVDFN